MAEKWDAETRQKFNTDPKYEGDRNRFDDMVTDAFERIAAKKAKDKPADEPSFWDTLFGGIKTD